MDDGSGEAPETTFVQTDNLEGEHQVGLKKAIERALESDDKSTISSWKEVDEIASNIIFPCNVQDHISIYLT